MVFVSYRTMVVSKEIPHPAIQKLKGLIDALGGHESFVVVDTLPKETQDIHVCVFLGLTREELEKELNGFEVENNQVLIAIGDYFYDGDTSSFSEKEKSPIEGFGKLHINLGEKYFLNAGFGHQSNNFLNLFHHK